jgi:hypothetical protein
MSFKNKAELVQFVKEQTNVQMANDNNLFNKKRNILYTEIDRQNKITVLGLLNKYGIRYESHINNSYFVYVR